MNGEERSNSLIAAELGHARYFLLSEILDREVKTTSGAAVGKLDDFLFRDDPKYAEVTHIIVRRPFGRQPWIVSWENVEVLDRRGPVVRDPPGGAYPDFDPTEGQLLLRDDILDKRILDIKGLGVDVVYDIQLLDVGQKLFIVAADVSRTARRRRSLLFRMGSKASEGGSQNDKRIPWKYVQPLGPDITSTKGDVRLDIPREMLSEIHPEDLADIMEDLNHDDRLTIFNALSGESAAEALVETEPRVQREILHHADIGRVEHIFTYLSPVAIADILSALPRQESEELLKVLKSDVHLKVRDIMEKHDVPVSTFALQKFLRFPAGITVEDAIARFRKEAPESYVRMYIYIVDPDLHLLGVVNIKDLLQADPSSSLEEIMTTNVMWVSPDSGLGGVLELFQRYHFRAIPVVDSRQKIIGIVREKDAFALERGEDFSGRVL